MSDQLKKNIRDFAQLHEYQLQEVLLAVKEKSRSLSIGLPKEDFTLERRIGLQAEAVRQLVDAGQEVKIEAGAGLGAKISDREFSEAGAQIVYSPDEIYACDLVLKISQPSHDNIRMMRPRSTLISALQFRTLSPDTINLLKSKRITAIAYELVRDEAGGLPFIRSMSEIAGSVVMLIASEYLSSAHEGKGIILGGITGVPPTKVVILGAGTVAEFAARTALGLGAEVKVFDNRLDKLRRLKQSLGFHQLYTSTLNDATLKRELPTADLVIGSLRAVSVSPYFVPEEIVACMQPDSVIIDVGIDFGGCFETSELTSHRQPTFKKHGVIHYCVPNIPSRAARTASFAFSNLFAPILQKIADRNGIEEMIFSTKNFARGVYCHNGELTNEMIARRFNMRFKDLALLIAARF